jgi:hypothetical protein
MFKHFRIKKLISAYIDGEVSDREKEFIENHLKECFSCRKYWEDLKKMSSFLKNWEDESISPDLEQKIKINFLNDKNKGVIKMKSKKLLIGSTTVLVTLLIFVIVGRMFMGKEVYKKRVKVDKKEEMVVPGEELALNSISQYKYLGSSNLYYLGSSIGSSNLYLGNSNLPSTSDYLISTPFPITRGYKKPKILSKIQKKEEKIKDVFKRETKPSISEEGPIVIVEPYSPATGKEEKIIRKAEIKIEVKDVEKTYDKIIEIIKEEEGYLGGAHFEKKKTGKIEAKIVLRVPKDNFEETLGKIRKLGKVEKFDIQSIDVSQEYASLISELNTLKIVYDKIVEKLKQKRTDIEGAIQLESELTPIAKRITEIRNQVSRYDNLIRMSTITVYLTSFSWRILWEENLKKIHQEWVELFSGGLRKAIDIMPLVLTFIFLVIVVSTAVLLVIKRIKK